MNEEFAVEPTAFENALQLKYVLEKFGFHRGRFIVGFPSKWVKQVYEHIQRFPDTEQAKASRLLQIAKEDTAVVKSGELGYEPAISWIENVHRISKNQQSFDGVIASKNNPFEYPTVHEVDDDYFGSSYDIRLEGTAENYANVARRLLQHSSEITIVDPYL